MHALHFFLLPLMNMKYECVQKIKKLIKKKMNTGYILYIISNPILVLGDTPGHVRVHSGKSDCKRRSAITPTFVCFYYNLCTISKLILTCITETESLEMTLEIFQEKGNVL